MKITHLWVNLKILPTFSAWSEMFLLKNRYNKGQIMTKRYCRDFKNVIVTSKNLKTPT